MPVGMAVAASYAARLLVRKGMQNYNDLDTCAPKAELRARKINWGKKKDPGKRRLLEDDDGREKLTDGAGKGKKKEKRKRKGGSAGGAGRRGKKAQASKNTGGQGRDRASPRGDRALRVPWWSPILESRAAGFASH